MDYLVILLLIALSAFFSSVETAFSSVNRIRLKNLAASGNKRAKKALEITEDFDRTLSAILIGNNIVNIAAASLGTVVFTREFGDAGLGISTLVMTVVVITFGEILPKSYAKLNAEDVTLFSVRTLIVLRAILYPLTAVFSLLSGVFSRKKEKGPSVTQEELKVIIDEISEEGILHKDETELVHSALEFDDIIVKEILTPRVDITAIDIEDDLETVKTKLYESRYSRLPVYECSIDNIIGVMYKSEFFIRLSMNRDLDLRELVKKVLFVPSTIKISSLLRELQKNKIHMAIVDDEHGGTMGLVTMEDILEELVGEIWDESDEVEYPIVNLSDGVYRISGDADIVDVFETLGIEWEEDITDALTAGGWVLEELGRIPAEGDRFTRFGFEVTVTGVREQRVVSLEMSLIREEETASE